MDLFYSENFIAVFFGDGKDTRKTARRLYFDHKIRSYVFDTHTSFFTHIHPFIRTFSTNGFSYDENLLCYIESVLACESDKTALLFLNSVKFRSLAERNAGFVESHFITDAEYVIDSF